MALSSTVAASDHCLISAQTESGSKAKSIIDPDSSVDNEPFKNFDETTVDENVDIAAPVSVPKPLSGQERDKLFGRSCAINEDRIPQVYGRKANHGSVLEPKGLPRFHFASRSPSCDPKSSFWLKFGNSKRKSPKRSAWSHFQSPYDEHLRIKIISTSVNHSPSPLSSSFSPAPSPRPLFFPASLSSTLYSLPRAPSWKYKGESMTGGIQIPDFAQWEEESERKELESLIYRLGRKNYNYEFSSNKLANCLEHCEKVLSAPETDTVPRSLPDSDEQLSPSSIKKIPPPDKNISSNSLLQQLLPSAVDSDIASALSDSVDGPEWEKSREKIREEWALFFRKLEHLRFESVCDKPISSSHESINMIIEDKEVGIHSGLRHPQPSKTSSWENNDSFIAAKYEKNSENNPYFIFEVNIFNPYKDSLFYSDSYANLNGFKLGSLPESPKSPFPAIQGEENREKIRKKLVELSSFKANNIPEKGRCGMKSPIYISLNSPKENINPNGVNSFKSVHSISKTNQKDPRESKVINEENLGGLSDKLDISEPPKGSFLYSKTNSPIISSSNSKTGKPTLFLSGAPLKAPFKSCSLFELENLREDLGSSNFRGNDHNSTDSELLHRETSKKFSPCVLQDISRRNLEGFPPGNNKSVSKTLFCPYGKDHKENSLRKALSSGKTDLETPYKNSRRNGSLYRSNSAPSSRAFSVHSSNSKRLGKGIKENSKSIEAIPLFSKIFDSFKNLENFVAKSFENKATWRSAEDERPKNWILRLTKVILPSETSRDEKERPDSRYYRKQGKKKKGKRSTKGRKETSDKKQTDRLSFMGTPEGCNTPKPDPEEAFSGKWPNNGNPFCGSINKANQSRTIRPNAALVCEESENVCEVNNDCRCSNTSPSHERKTRKQPKKGKVEGEKRSVMKTQPPGEPLLDDDSQQLPSSLGSSSTPTVGGMSGRGKVTTPNAKKVAPPTVPDGGSASSSSSTCSSSSSSSSSSSHRHSGSSLSSGVFSGDQRSSFSSSLGEESASNPPPSPRSPGRDSGCDHAMLGSITSSGSTSSSTSNGSSAGSGHGARLGSVSSGGGGGSASPSHYQKTSQFTFPSQMPQFAHLMCPKPSPGSPHHLPSSESTYPYQPYSQQTSLEDQGIDVQSPGRSSPGSGSGSSTTGSTASSGNCRNSTTSLDSGRASSSTQTHNHRLSGQSCDSGSILRHSYHSSSSSLGSMEHDGTSHINVQELLNNGVPDSEVLRIWLSELHFEEHYEKFLSAGYDMPTISRMTPEDLNAIGITKPVHRKRLKAEITRLNISDGLPDFIPSRMEEWLTLLRLDSYTPSLKQQSYNTVEQVTQITWEDLEDVGITKLGHQKKVMLAIKRVKDIMAGKKFNSMSPVTHDGKIGSYAPHEVLICREGPDGRETYATLSEMRAYQNSNQFHDHHNRLGGPSDPGGQHLYRPQYGNYPGGFPSPVHPSQMHLKYPGAFQTPDKGVPQNMGPPTITYRPDVVAVNVRNARPRGLEEPIYGTYHTFFPSQRPSGLPSLPQRPMLPLQTAPHPQRSLDDGDITPTNEMAGMYEGGGTLPRPRTANKYRPVAKVTAKTRADVHEIPAQFCKKETPKPEHPTTKVPMVEKIFPASTNNTPQGTPKKLPPPPPPKRSNSVSESGTPKKEGAFPLKGLSYGYMGVKNNLQPDMAPDLPPPPPAPQDRGNHQHLPEDFPPPPPPLTCLTMATNAAKAASSVTNTSSNHCIEGTPATAYSPESDGEGGFRPRRNESNSSFKSTSSTDSGESLPFANDNAGTIKQRASRPHPSFALMESRPSPRSSPISSPALRRKEGIVLPTLRHPQPHSSVPNTLNGCQSTVKGVVNPSDAANDVLSDIGNMLANLTDELDAMLEQDLAMKSTKIP